MKNDKEFLKYLKSIYEGSFQRTSQVQGYHPQAGLNHHILTKSKNRRHDDDANFKKKDSGQEDIDEGIMIRLAGKLAQELLPKDVWYRHANQPQKNKEFVKTVVSDLARTLNRFYKSHNINVKIQEELLREIGAWRIDHYTGSNPGTIVPGKMVGTVLNDKDKEKKRAVEKDLATTLNLFWKRWKIPFRIDLSKKER